MPGRFGGGFLNKRQAKCRCRSMTRFLGVCGRRRRFLHSHVVVAEVSGGGVKRVSWFLPPFPCLNSFPASSCHPHRVRHWTRENEARRQQQNPDPQE